MTPFKKLLNDMADRYPDTSWQTRCELANMLPEGTPLAESMYFINPPDMDAQTQWEFAKSKKYHVKRTRAAQCSSDVVEKKEKIEPAKKKKRS